MKEKNLKNLVWILIVIILLAVSFIIYDKVLSVDKDVTPLEPEVDTEVIEELEKKVEEAKDDDEDEVKELEEKVEELEEKVEDLEEEEEVAAYEGENFIKVISPNDGAGFSTEPIEFTGEVSPNTDKIVATAYVEAGIGGGLNDVYTLENFEHGDTEFVYRAKEEWENLNANTIKYTFEAYFDDGSTESTSLHISYLTEDIPAGFSTGTIKGSYITIDSPADGSTFITASTVNPDNVTPLPIEFTGSVPINTTKIVVTAVGGNINCDLLDFQGPCIPYFEDIYTLQNFKHGDKSFIYRANFQLGNLSDYGEHKYTFTAHFDDGSTQSEQVTIYTDVEQ